MKSFAFVAICLVASCHRTDPSPPPTTVEPAPAQDTIGQPGSQDLAPLAGLPAQLGDESQHRPHSKVTVEHVFDALGAKGITLVTRHQVLASAAAASYCALGVTQDTIAIAVCEYPSHEAAVAGRSMMASHYARLVPDAVREINGNTLVTVANAAQHRDVRDRVLDTFKAL
jgi:hypothetical protein